MKTTRVAFLALGSNLGASKENIQRAAEEINQQVGNITARSSLYRTKPLPVPDLEQGDFLNAVIAVETSLRPEPLLTVLREIETKMGRTREDEIHWGPRVIDIDIIQLGGVILLSDKLTIPHPRYTERDFVLAPLAEIAPELRDPITAKTAQELLDNISTDQKTVIETEAFDS